MPAPSAIKGSPVRAFTAQTLAAYQDGVIDCRAANALRVEVIVQGSGASASIALYGGPTHGGPWLPLADPSAVQNTVTANRSFDCQVGTPYVKVRIYSIVGTFVGNQGFTITVTPYRGAGSSSVVGTVP